MKQSLCRIVVYTAVLLAAAPFPARALQDAEPSQAARDAGQPYLQALAAAALAFSQRDFSKALDKLDVADQIQPDIPDTWTMRGAIYAEQRAYEKAGDAFERAARLNPGDFWAPYNSAQLQLMEKKYGEAAASFQKLLVYGGHEELVQFKMVFADLLDEKPDAAKAVLDSMKFPSDTPAYYFAHAAWGFARKDSKEGNYWTRTGLKVFGLSRCVSFYDAMVGVGWLPMREADGSVPEANHLSTIPPVQSGTMGLLGTPP